MREDCFWSQIRDTPEDELAASETPRRTKDVVAAMESRFGEWFGLIGDRDHFRWGAAAEVGGGEFERALQDHFDLGSSGDIDLGSTGEECNDTGGSESGSGAFESTGHGVSGAEAADGTDCGTGGDGNFGGLSGIATAMAMTAKAKRERRRIVTFQLRIAGRTRL